MMEASTGAVPNQQQNPAVMTTWTDYYYHYYYDSTPERTIAALRKSAVSSVDPTDKTTAIAFGRGTGSEAAAARARAAPPTPARSQSRCCANDQPRGWGSSCRPPPYCLCRGIETVGHPCVP